MFKQLLTQVQNKYKEKLEENEKYKELLNKANTLPKFYNFYGKILVIIFNMTFCINKP